MKNFHEALNVLIRDLRNLVNVSHQECPRTGARFVTLVEESRVALRYRWDEAEGFVYCGEVR